jgi:protein MpaA
MCMPPRLRCVVAAVALTLSGAFVFAQPAAAAKATPVLGKRVIGHSVQGRPIVAYHLGDPTAKTTSLIVGEMHGDEHAGVVVAKSLIHGSVSVEGINLWVIPTMNPDGDAAHTRQNAHGVDLNRNWPHNWAHLTGQYYSGRKPLSEPETRAVWRFLRNVRPRYVVSLHQPLDGVDKTAGSGKAYRQFRDALSRNLNLSVKDFQCWSVCHGSMSGWYQQHRIGVAVETVEFGWHPTHTYLVGTARRGIIAALGGHFGALSRHDPRLRVTIEPDAQKATVTGWAYDPDKPGTRLLMRLDEGNRMLGRQVTRVPSPALDKRRGISGRHAFSFHIAATPGRHRYCVTARNLAAGANTRSCYSVAVPS